MINLSSIEVRHCIIPDKAGLYINTYHYPMVAYELWTEIPGGLARHGWFAVSEKTTQDATLNFIRTWLDREGIAYVE